MTDALRPRLPRPPWRQRLFRWRDRMVGDPAFQAWAMRFPLTRHKARQNAARLFDLSAGFVYAQTLAACVRLDLFDLLAEGPLTAAEIGHATDLSEAAATRLLRAASALGLVTPSGDRWRLAELGAAARGAPGVAEMVRHHEMFYADLADPVALLRGERAPTRLGAFWGYSGGQADLESAETAPYSALMASSQAMVAAEVLDAYDFRPHRRLMDLGGGDGTFLKAVRRRHPHLALSLFDLPPVAESARARLGAEGIEADIFGGDFLRDPLPQGADLISLIRILHDHDDAPVGRLLAAIHRALPAGGTLLVAEPLAAGARNPRVGDAYFGFYMLAMGAGQPRRFDELSALLANAGFTAIRRHRSGARFLTEAITARRP